MEHHSDSPDSEKEERLRRLRGDPDYQALKRLADLKGKSVGNLEALLPEEEEEPEDGTADEDKEDTGRG